MGDVPFQEVSSKSKKRRKKKQNRLQTRLDDQNYYAELSRMHVDDDPINDSKGSESEDSGDQDDLNNSKKKEIFY